VRPQSPILPSLVLAPSATGPFLPLVSRFGSRATAAFFSRSHY
jgi:hypothetical protein